uniref:Uncharacterized protein n=1 Tax=Daucus carota subsp. sativus TaxID=79200 RepID=A0A162AM16_DAUCS
MRMKVQAQPLCISKGKRDYTALRLQISKENRQIWKKGREGIHSQSDRPQLSWE